MVKPIWPIKYRPRTIDDYIFQDNKQKELFIKYIKDGSIPNLMLIGHRGTGKTTIALILKNALGIEDSDFLQLNASHDNSVDVIRQKVTAFATTMAMGSFKLIIFDEADWLSQSAQATLRGFLEDEAITSNVRCIFTVNYPKKIMPEIRSRCVELIFNKLNKNILLEKSAEILSKEKVKVKSIELLEKYIELTYPDFRKLLNLLDENTVNGVLQEPTEVDSAIEYKLQILELLDKNNWESIRDIVCANVDGDEWPEVYKFLYDYIHETDKFKDPKKWKQAIVIIADHLYRHGLCADSEINFCACIIRLTEL